VTRDQLKYYAYKLVTRGKFSAFDISQRPPTSGEKMWRGVGNTAVCVGKSLMVFLGGDAGRDLRHLH